MLLKILINQFRVFIGCIFWGLKLLGLGLEVEDGLLDEFLVGELPLLCPHEHHFTDIPDMLLNYLFFTPPVHLLKSVL